MAGNTCCWFSMALRIVQHKAARDFDPDFCDHELGRCPISDRITQNWQAAQRKHFWLWNSVCCANTKKKNVHNLLGCTCCRKSRQDDLSVLCFRSLFKLLRRHCMENTWRENVRSCCWLLADHTRRVHTVCHMKTDMAQSHSRAHTLHVHSLQQMATFGKRRVVCSVPALFDLCEICATMPLVVHTLVRILFVWVSVVGQGVLQIAKLLWPSKSILPPPNVFLVTRKLKF